MVQNGKMRGEIEFDIWSDREPVTSHTWGKYVAISGNTGAGKSTLMRAIVSAAASLSIKAVGIDERTLHHPFLKLMFSQPARYGFPVQINFLLQRHLVLLRWLSSGHTVIIERSHLDDQVFVDHLLDGGHISRDEHSAYVALANVLHKKIPLPDILVCLEVMPKVSMARIARDEASGKRPQEFPNESVKFSFVSSWYERINALHESMTEQVRRQESNHNRVVLRRPAETSTEELAGEVIEHLKGMLIDKV